MSLLQVSICTSRPLFMLHISMYSCRCLVMSDLAVARSSCTNTHTHPHTHTHSFEFACPVSGACRCAVSSETLLTPLSGTPLSHIPLIRLHPPPALMSVCASVCVCVSVGE